jgi:hypothetical protein
MRRPLAALSVTLVLSTVNLTVVGLPSPALADDYTDADYRDYDLDSQRRGNGRQPAQATDPAYGQAFVGAGADSWLADAGRAANDVRAGRVYTGGGRWIPGGSAGDPRAYYDVTSTEVAFTARTGAKLTGHVWAPIGAPGERPGVVITSGSIQGYEAMYFWAARDLARNGYTVLTWDAQGQGRSEGVGHAPGSPAPTMDGVPFQQPANFVEATVDALEFFLSTPDDPYVPPTWTAEEAAAAQAAAEGVEQLDGHNPLFGLLDHDRIGLAGHSLGGTGVGTVQQCSDEGEVWRTLPELCNGGSYPIRAVVGWDGLPGGVTPVVPAMDQNADGYFFSTTPQPTAPGAESNLGPFDAWSAAGLDAYSLTIRGGTHLEWCDLPYLLPATTYGTGLATFYTTAWFDRYLAPEPTTRLAALEDLLSAPEARDGEPWSGTNLSASRASAYRLTLPPGGAGAGAGAAVAETRDLRATAGWAAVGDWAGANAE